MAVGSLDDPDALFFDTAHCSELGNYFVALVHFATLYRRNPVGIDVQDCSDMWGDPVSVPDLETQRALQQIAWDAVIAAPYSGVVGP